MSISDIRANHILNMAGDGTKDFNCWGASQYVLKARDTLGWVENQEMTDWLEENTEIVKKPEVGDILTLFNTGMWFDGQRFHFGRRLVHTAVYLGDGEYLHKLGQSRAERVAQRTVFKAYKNSYDEHQLRRLKCD